MIRRLLAAAMIPSFLSLGCTKAAANSLTGSESQVYDLTFNSVLITLQGTVVSIKYEDGTSTDPAVLIVNTVEIENVANSSIDLTQLVQGGQLRGVLYNVNGSGNGVTNDLMVTRGTVTFDQVPKVDKTLTGEFAATLSDGYTLNGTFSSKVIAAPAPIPMPAPMPSVRAAKAP
jgi:hypothetical protein